MPSDTAMPMAITLAEPMYSSQRLCDREGQTCLARCLCGCQGSKGSILSDAYHQQNASSCSNRNVASGMHADLQAGRAHHLPPVVRPESWEQAHDQSQEVEARGEPVEDAADDANVHRHLVVDQRVAKILSAWWAILVGERVCKQAQEARGLISQPLLDTCLQSKDCGSNIAVSHNLFRSGTP